jgi:hypothetical protein
VIEHLPNICKALVKSSPPKMRGMEGWRGIERDGERGGEKERDRERVRERSNIHIKSQDLEST